MRGGIARAAWALVAALALATSLLAGCSATTRRSEEAVRPTASQSGLSAPGASTTASTAATAGAADEASAGADGGASDVPAEAASAEAAAGDAPGAVPRHVPQPFDPEQLDPRVTQDAVGSTIGVSGWSASVRPPASVTGAIKRRLMRQHGYAEPLSAYELDHFIPLGVGGSSNPSNLWLEPIAEARLKDRDEALVHRKVTGGLWTLAQGQQYIRDHWAIHYAQ